MKRKFLLLLTILCANFLSAQNITFLDYNLKQGLLNTDCIDSNNDSILDSDADLNNDGEISIQEASSITYLSLKNLGITSFNEIHFFSSVKYLNLSGNFLTAINVSNNQTLESLNISDNNLSNLDVTQNQNLVGLILKNNNLQSINTTQNPNLISLNLNGNNFQDIDVASNDELLWLHLKNNQFKNIDLERNSDLIMVDLSSNPLDYIYINNENPLQFLNVQNTNLSYVCTNEEYISHYENMILDLYPNCQVNSFCDFKNIRDIYALNGNIYFDADNDGCEENEFMQQDINFQIFAQNGETSLISSDKTNYEILFPTEGTYLVRPVFSNMEQYHITPQVLQVHFSFDNGIIFLDQDFCISPLTNTNGMNGVNQEHYLDIETPFKEELKKFLEKEEKIAKNISIFPNPIEDVMFISGQELINEIEIIDIYGKRVFRKEYTLRKKELQLNLGNIKSGIYSLKISSDKRQTVKKIVVQ
ncbi:T9SS type A sorting domain-containing protein [Aureivirga marina]|uniref:T9SS type A sorting domain-containing protein n=1 Tax=Aureivirga marina TaxID=1182451 RepID=UPI0018CB5CAA|nr:T9SS type A sorting domain-containing protein [Aureivirga marina]